jgi:enolase-phosphatase E1
MVRFAGKGILLDIEGTTSSLAFVRDVLFPYARRHLEEFLRKHWNIQEVRTACERIAREAGAASLAAWGGDRADPDAIRSRICEEVIRLMDRDAKAGGLKDLQGLIWREGYEAGELRSHVYPDVPPALAAWRAAGVEVRIYSSGSTAAQRLFFAQTILGDLSGFFTGHYDTTVGAKRAPSSYAAIAADMQLVPSEILFLSDVKAELDAAASAGMQTALVVRPGNDPFSAEPHHACVENFGEISFTCG